TAATALSQMLAQEVTLSVSHALAPPLAEAVATAGPPEEVVTGVVIPLDGDLRAIVLLLIPIEDARTLCSLLGVEAGTEYGDSALMEIGNILGASYLNALAAITGLDLVLCPPQLATDTLGAIVASLLAEGAAAADHALVLNSELGLATQPCSVSFLMIPTGGSVNALLAPLGLASPE
ncbi:MAG: chemotaxis protein CheC, partial [Solirubrobacteraceae bacterium]